MKKIILFLLLVFSLNLYAERIEFFDPNYITPRGDTGGWVFVQKNDTYALPIKSMGAGISIDSASISIDTAGLAGYNQVQEILDYVYYDSQTFIYSNNSDNSDSIVTQIITTKVKKLYTEVPTAILDYYGLTDGVTDERKDQIKSITY